MVATLGRQNSIWEKANKLKDEDMLRRIRGQDENKCTDMAAVDFHYHRKCISEYLTKRVCTQKTSSTVTSPYEAALSKLVSRIHKPLLKNDAVFFVTALRDEFREYLKDYGVVDVETYRSQSLLARLQK